MCMYPYILKITPSMDKGGDKQVGEIPRYASILQILRSKNITNTPTRTNFIRSEIKRNKLYEPRAIQIFSVLLPI